MVGPRRVNRKKGRKACYPFPLAAALTLAAMLALSYLWLCSRCEVLAESLRSLESESKAVQSRLMNEEFKWARLSSPRSIETALARFHLPLSWPSERQVVVISRRLNLDDLELASAPVPQLARRSAGWDSEGHD